MNRKWRFTFWRAVLDFATVIAGIGLAYYAATTGPGVVVSSETAVTIMKAGFVDLALNAGTYFASNVAQKGVVGKWYKPELDDRLVEPGETQEPGGAP